MWKLTTQMGRALGELIDTGKAEESFCDFFSRFSTAKLPIGSATTISTNVLLFYLRPYPADWIAARETYTTSIYAN